MLAMSVDPYMRGRMREGASYAAPWEIGETMQGGAVGRVVASRSPDVPEGALVLSRRRLAGRRRPDARARPSSCPSAEGIPASYHLGVLGMPGLTAWAGLFRVAGFREGDAVFVSGAAGAVGSLVGQFARLRGASRGGRQRRHARRRCAWLTGELGFDAAFDYHDGPVAQLLADAAPDGIDVYFDNVGGEHLDAALGALHVHGRAALCGAISGYNATEPPPGPRNIGGTMVAKRLRLRGLPRRRPHRPAAGVHRDGLRLAALGRARRPGDGPRGAGRRGRRVPRPPARRQHRQDGRAARSRRRRPGA